MRLGVLLIPTDPVPAAVRRARHLESLGYAHLWTYDHLTWRRYRDRPWFTAVPWLTAVAAGTGRIGVGTMVTSPNFRHPLTLAKDAITLDHISGGRLTLGVGAGGIGFDATVFGETVLTPQHRASRMADFVAVLDGLLRSQTFTSDNSRYPIEHAHIHPQSLHRPRIPLAIAAAGPKTLGLAARYGDVWITEGDPKAVDPTPEQTKATVRRQVTLLEDHCARMNRDPAEVRRLFLLSNKDERPLQSLGAFSDFLGRYSELGFTDVVFHDPRAEDPVWNDDPAIVEAIAEAHLA